MKKPNLDILKKMMEKGESFELTDQEYKKKTTADFPKNKYYAENRSAIARAAKEYGYQIQIIPRRIQFNKMIGGN